MFHRNNKPSPTTTSSSSLIIPATQQPWIRDDSFSSTGSGCDSVSSHTDVSAPSATTASNHSIQLRSQQQQQDYDKVWADSDRDYWMTAEEAKSYGMIDEVLTRKKV